MIALIRMIALLQQKRNILLIFTAALTFIAGSSGDSSLGATGTLEQGMKHFVRIEYCTS